MAYADKNWSDVPDEYFIRWRDTFEESTEGVTLTAACPVCGKHALRRWFNVHKRRRIEEYGRVWQGRGGQWQWCRACRRYVHYSGLVPDWWHSDLPVDPETLMHDPGTIDSVLDSVETTE